MSESTPPTDDLALEPVPVADAGQPPVPVADADQPPVPARPPLSEWFWRRQALAEVRVRQSHRTAGQRDDLRRAHLAEEAAARLFDPVDPLRYGSGVPLAITLYREALFWGLRSLRPDPVAPDLPRAFALLSADERHDVAREGIDLDALQASLTDLSWERLAAMAPDDQRALADASRQVVADVIEESEGPEAHARQLLRQRWTRTSFLALVAAACVAGVAVLASRLSQAPDLAAGKPWKASSAYAGFNARTHTCDGNATTVLFHTNEEDSPWFEIDLGSPQTFRVVDVENRKDGLRERAVPLVVEVSNDHTKWTEVARQTDTFRSWHAQFAPQTDRYVRLRVPRRTFLHLERVNVRAR